MSEIKYENLSTMEAQERDYKKRVERIEFTDGLERSELLHKINTVKESRKKHN